MSEHQLDARHMLCPMPVIKTQQAIAGLVNGEQLCVLCTDPGVRYDVPAWLKMHGHQLISSNCNTAQAGDEIYFLIKVVKRSQSA